MILPTGSCIISNTLVFEGTNGLGIFLEGQAGWGAGALGTSLVWNGPNFGTMMQLLGCNNCLVEHVDFDSGTGKPQNGLWVDASNTVTQVAYATSGNITRASNVVTATTSIVHAIASSRILKVSGCVDTTFNGTFRALYASSTMSVSWIQNGPNGSTTGCTVTNYQSTPSNAVLLSHVKTSGATGFVSTVSTVTGSNPYTFTTSTSHFVTAGGNVVYDGSASDSTYKCAYHVSSITSSTVFVAVPLAGTGCTPSGSNSSGGTLTSDSAGIRVAHNDSLTPQISQLVFRDLFVQGDQLGGSITAIESDATGNTKNFAFENLIVNGTRYGLTGFQSGSTTVRFYNGGLVTPDSTPQLAAIDFVGNEGEVSIDSAEIETTNGRFWVNTGNSTSVKMDGVSWQSTCPTDDQCVQFAGTLTMTASRWDNARSSSSAPYIACGNPLFGSNTCSFISIGNKFANVAVGGGATRAPGWLPFQDAGANTFQQATAYYQNKTTNITSIGDMGSTGTNVSGTLKSLNTVLPRLTAGSDCFSSASPAICGSATSGSAALAGGATTEVIGTTAVTANSTIILTRDNSLGTKLDVTCNTQSSLVLGTLYGSARTGGTSFTVALDVAPTINPVCFSWEIIGAD